MFRISEFWARGFRSLGSVRINTNRTFNVFYGANGVGKTNILAAIDTLFGVAAYRAAIPNEETVLDTLSPAHDLPLAQDDRAAFGDTTRTVLGATVQHTDDNSLLQHPEFGGIRILSFEVTYEWATSSLKIDVLKASGTAEFAQNIIELKSVRPVITRNSIDALLRHLFVERLNNKAFCLISAERHPKSEKRNQKDVYNLLRNGNLITAIALAERSPDVTIRRRLKLLRTYLESPPFNRPPFDIVYDETTQDYDLREPLPEIGDLLNAARDVSLELTGLGINQIYSILSQLFLLGSRTIGIEEPEAHLHAPTTGRHLREILVKIVYEEHLDQIFIATHSNLFDLDQNGYLDVTFDSETGTSVEWKKLSVIDKKHLYEPGPTKHALIDFINTTGDDEIGLHDPDGKPVTMKQMLDLLQNDDKLALEFLRNVQSAAVRLAVLRQKKKA